MSIADVYENCPLLENEQYLLTLVSKDDWRDLIKVYSDVKAVPFFNSDNCNGDDFYYTTEARMKQAIDFWLAEYGRRYYVRWSVRDKISGEIIGTIEFFNRKAEDYFNDCGLLRVDLRSDYELTARIKPLLSLVIETCFDLFACDKIATKAIPTAVERIYALKSVGFKLSDKKIIGHDGSEYGEYYVLNKIV